MRTFPDRAARGALALYLAVRCRVEVLSRREEELPVEAIRDFLGLVRALYAERQSRGAPRAELARIARVGTLLTTALELAVHPVGTVGQRAAWAQAERAAHLAPELLGPLEPAAPVVRAAVGRVHVTRAGRS